MASLEKWGGPELGGQGLLLSLQETCRGAQGVPEFLETRMTGSVALGPGGRYMPVKQDTLFLLASLFYLRSYIVT